MSIQTLIRKIAGARFAHVTRTQTFALLGILGAGAWILFALAGVRVPDLQNPPVPRQVLYPLGAEQSLGISLELVDPRVDRIDLYGEVKGSFGFGDRLTIHVRQSRSDPVDLIIQPVSLLPLLFNQPIQVAIPERLRQQGQVYILLQSDARDGSLLLWGNSTNTLAGSQLYRNGSPVDGMVSFSIYQKIDPSLAAGWLPKILQKFMLLSGITLGAWLLGGLLLFLLGTGGTLSGIYRFALQLSVGAAVPGIFCYAINLAGLPVSRGSFVGFVFVLGVLGVLRGSGSDWKRQAVLSDLKVWLAGWRSRAGILLLYAFLFVLALLFAALQLSLMEMPPGSDAVFHYRLIADLRETARIPYDLNYPAGFHASVYLVSLLLPGELQSTMLLVGMWASVLAGFTFSLLLKRYDPDRFQPALLAALIWFLLPFPTYLINWGRYPVLWGMALFPAAVWSMKAAFQKKLSPVIAILLCVAVACAHYGTLIACITWLAVDVWKYLRSTPSFHRIALKGSVLRKVLFFMLPLVLLLSYRLVVMAQSGDLLKILAQSAQEREKEDIVHLLWLTFQNGGGLVWMLAILSGVFLPREAWAADLLLWMGGMLLFYGVQLLFLGAPISSLSNILLLFSILIVILAAHGLKAGFLALKSFVSLARPSLPRFYPAFAGMLVLSFFILAGFVNTLDRLNPLSGFFSVQDRTALEWMEREIPQNTVILVPVRKIGGIIRPTDGSAWAQTFLSARVTPYYYEGQIDGGDLIKQCKAQQAGYLLIHKSTLSASQMEAFRAGSVYENPAVILVQVK